MVFTHNALSLRIRPNHINKRKKKQIEQVMDHTIGQVQMICALHVNCVDNKCCHY